ncbi:MAG: biotin/lipoyl-containing protein [Gemmatimonadaceae bacterium]
MKYLVDIAGARVAVDLDGASATVGGSTSAVHLAEVAGTPVRLITIGGVQHRVVARRNGPKGRYILWLDGWRFDVEALDERTRAIRDLGLATAAAAGPAPIVAPMPGLIVKVHVAVGDRVDAGQAVVVMEAMKMENELRAPSPGTVRAIAATPGVAVEKGAVLVELQ